MGDNYLVDGVHLVCDVTTGLAVGFRVEHWRRLFLRRSRGLVPYWYWYRFASLLSRLIKAFNPGTTAQAKLYHAVVDYACS
jgi:hypothetical protein